MKKGRKCCGSGFVISHSLALLRQCRGNRGPLSEQTTPSPSGRVLKGRDLYGELTRAAHADGLVVFARMDSNRAFEPFYKAHPDWFAVDAEGKPYRSDDLYVTCISGPYYEEFIPEVLREIIAWEKADGFTDNSWSGLGRNSICYCTNCKRRFRQFSGKDLPRKNDWDDPAYRQWIEWSYQRRLEIWDLNNRTTKAAGGPNCIWAGMISGNPVSPKLLPTKMG